MNKKLLNSIPTYEDILSASGRLKDLAVKTPLLEAPLFNKLLGVRVLLKAETLQLTGSFKFRGAFNAISIKNEQARLKGVVAYSSGNHAQGVAHAAAILDLPAVVVMPEDAPKLKINNTLAFGAKVIKYNRFLENREDIGEALSTEKKFELIKPYDDPLIIAGQGTIGAEILSQCNEKKAQLNAVYVPCGGGGLTAGIATAIKHNLPSVKIFAVEPDGFDDTSKSIACGKRVRNLPNKKSICDALLAEIPGKITFFINSKILSGAVSVSDKDTLSAMKNAFKYFKLIIEPGGAVALAALIKNASAHQGETIVVVCSGSNVDPEIFSDAIS